MEKIIPLFPLNLVVFPNEELNLHIFEPRYRQLVKDCQDQALTFGIPTFIDDKVADYGTEVHITQIERIYDDGRLDIKTRGLQVFKMITFENPLDDRLYAGGLVKMIKTDLIFDQNTQNELIRKVSELYDILQINVNISEQIFNIVSFEIAHKVGLSIEQEYEILQLETENERQEYLIDHLNKAIPVINEMERTKQIIRMNGHFKYFDPLNF
ncbi:MAG: LON peptidase substrate-binding domain-containing protein [Microscillaceae bacterium]|nr:LON peptidase substrate-binding domain-containing protein [Microscillaceae bacterium]